MLTPKTKKLKSAAISYAVPRTREEADEFIFKIGEAQRDRESIQTAMNERLAALKAEYESRAEPLNAAIAALMKGLQAYCEQNRDALLPAGSKTVRFGNGEVSWRSRPASVRVRDTVRAISWYAQHRLRQFLRIKEELNKEEMLKSPTDAAKNPFVTIGSAGEDFYVKPFRSELEEVA